MASAAALASLPTDHRDRSAGFLACVSITTAAALFLVSLRTYVRAAIVRKFGPDDYTILGAMVCGILAVAIDGVQVHYGFGKHASHVSPQNQIEVRRWNFALRVPILVGSGLSKISISLLLLRLLGNAAGRPRRFLLHGINVFIAIYTLIDIINDVTSCNPTAKAWDFALPGSCRTPESIVDPVYFQGACAAAVSLLLSALPTIFFASLQMPMRKKLVIILLTSLGVFDAICSIIRTALLPNYEKSLDFTYTAIPITLWASLELTLAILAACIPTLRPLFSSIYGSTTGGRASDYTPGGKGYIKRSGGISGLSSKMTGRGYQHHSSNSHDMDTHISSGGGAGDHNRPYHLSSFSVGGKKGRDDVEERSYSSTEFLRNPGGIRKTTDIQVVV